MNPSIFGKTSTTILNQLLPHQGDQNIHIYEKTSFSMLPCGKFDEIIKKGGNGNDAGFNVVLYGVLAEACILQTLLDLLEIKASGGPIN